MKYDCLVIGGGISDDFSHHHGQERLPHGYLKNLILGPTIRGSKGNLF